MSNTFETQDHWTDEDGITHSRPLMVQSITSQDLAKCDPWLEYDSAAKDLARKGLTGKIGDPLPLNMSKAAVDLINEDPEAFQLRVRQSAYALSMEGIDLECAASNVDCSSTQCYSLPLALNQSRLQERLAWLDRAHESIQWYAENSAPYSECFDERIANVLDLQSMALDSIIHWTQVEYYK